MIGLGTDNGDAFERPGVDEDSLGYLDELEGADREDHPEGVDPIARLTALYASYASTEQKLEVESVDIFMQRVQAVMKFIKVINPSIDMTVVEMRVAELAIMEKDEQELAFDRLDYLAHWLFTGETTMPREAEGSDSLYMTSLGEIVQALLTEDIQTGTYYQGDGFRKAFDRIFGKKESDDAGAY